MELAGIIVGLAPRTKPETMRGSRRASRVKGEGRREKGEPSALLQKPAEAARGDWRYYLPVMRITAPFHLQALRFAALIAAVLTGLSLSAQQPTYDLLIRGGRVVDGAGNPPFTADVGIRGDRIASVGRLADAKATREIDARGLVVAPGFIDLHTHSDLPLINDGNAESKVRQGVTVDVIGESTSVAPRDGLARSEGHLDRLHRLLEGAGPEGHLDERHLGGVVHQMRLVVMGYSAGPANAAELERMKAADAALDA